MVNLNAVDLTFCSGKFVGSLMQSIVFFVTQIYQTILTTSAVRMNNAAWYATQPLIMALSVALAQSGTISVWTISVWTLPPR